MKRSSRSKWGGSVIVALYALAMAFVGFTTAGHSHFGGVNAHGAWTSIAAKDCGAPARGDHSKSDQACCAACVVDIVLPIDPPATPVAYVLDVEQEFEIKSFSRPDFDLAPADIRSRAPPVFG